MNNNLKSILSPKEWLIEETNFDKKKLNVFETIFTVGNGYLGTRGSLEEGHLAGFSGTYIHGVFDAFDSFIIDLVNAPDWTALSIWVEGEKLSLHTCQTLEYYRALDLKQGLLYRKTKFKDRKGRITNYESIRYANFKNKNQFEIKVSITPENYSGNIKIESITNGSVSNLDLEPAYKEKPTFIPEVRWDKWTKSKHLNFVDSGNTESGIFLEMETLERPYKIIYNSNLSIKNIDTKISNQFDYEKICQATEFHASEGKNYHIEKVTTIFTSREIEKTKLKSASENLLKESLRLNFEGRFKQHQQVWQNKWNDCNIEIEGDDKAIML
jgi:kojibiose phosphorylase